MTGGKITMAAIWTVATRFLNRGIGLISMLILARLLQPEDFGLVAIAMSVYAIVQLLEAFGFDTVLIQNQQATTAHYNTAWTIKAVFGVILTLLTMLVAVPASKFFREPRIVPMLFAISPMFLIGGLMNIGIVDFRKNYQFHKDFVLNVSAKLAGFVATISLVIYHQSHWVLVTGILTTAVIQLILSYAMHPFRPRWDLTHHREIIGFSKWLLLNNFLNYLSNRSPELLLGRLSTPAAVGIFNIGHEIATLSTTEAIAPISRASFPAFSALAQQPVALARTYVEILAFIALIAIPIGLGTYTVAPYLVEVALGAQWTAAVPVVEISSLYGMINAVNGNSGYIYLAIGKPRILSWLTLASLALLLPLLYYLCSTRGPVGASFAFLITLVVMTPISCWVLSRVAGIAVSSLVGAVWRPALAAGVMLFAINAAEGQLKVLRMDTNNLVNLLILVGVGAVVYCLAELALWAAAGRPPGPELQILQKVTAFRRRGWSTRRV